MDYTSELDRALGELKRITGVEVSVKAVTPGRDRAGAVTDPLSVCRLQRKI